MTNNITALRGSVETRIRTKKQGELHALRQRYTLATGDDSVNTILGILRQPFGSPQGGRLTRLLVKECKRPAPLGVADDLLVWSMLPSVARHCHLVGDELRDDAHQEGLMAILEVARSFKCWGISDANFADAFRKSVLRQIARFRRQETRHKQLVMKCTKHLRALELEVMNGDDKRQEITTVVFYPDEREAAAKMLLAWLGNGTDLTGLDAFVANAIGGETTKAYAKRTSSSVAFKTDWERARKQVTRVTKRLRVEFADARGEYVAVESLWVSGSGATDVPMDRLSSEWAQGGEGADDAA